MTEAKKVLVKQVRSGNGRVPEIKATLRALGVGRIGSAREHSLTKPVYGMLRRVRHLVLVKEVQ